jgi:PAS domain S-box-containing protein
MPLTYFRKRRSLIALAALHLGVAALTVGLALALTLPLRDELNPAVWGFFYGAVLIGAYFVGPVAALLAAAIAIPLGIYFLLPPYEKFAVEDSNAWLPAIMFGVISVMIAGIDWFRRRAEVARDRSERQYGHLFEGAGVSLWREDFSEVFKILEEMRARGVDDIGAYLDANPDIVERAIAAVKILDVNSYTVELFGARNKKDMLDSLADVFTLESREAFKRELVMLYEGGRFVQDQIALQRLDGEEFVALFTVTVLGAPPSTDVLVSVLDISARHAAETALKQHQERLELALSAGRMGTFEWDIAAQTIRLGAEIEALRGADPNGDFEGSITQFLEMVHPEDRERLQLAVTRTLQAGAGDLDVECRGLSTNGRTVWFAAKGRVLRDGAGMPVRISGVAWDISGRKQYELTLQESEERFRAMADTAPVMIWLADTANMGMWFNRPWLEFRGRTLEEELGAGWISGIHQDDLDGAVATCQSALDRREEFRMEFRLRRADGEYRWVLDHGVPRYGAGGEFAGYIGSCIDVHERKESEERDRFLAETSAILVSSLDYSVSLDRIVRSVVPVFADFCVVDLLRGDGKFERMAMAYHDETREANLWEVLKQRPPGPESGHLVMRAVVERTHQLAEVGQPVDLVKALAQDDEHRAALAELAPRRILVIPMIASGRPIGTMTLTNSHPAGQFTEHDIGTLEALAERAALAVENAQLYARAQEVLGELRKANAAKDEFLGMVSHELRTPVTTMYSGARLLISRYDELPDAVKRDIIRDVESESERLQLIIENLLALARQELGQRVQPEPVSVQRTVASAVRRLEKARPDRVVKVECCGKPHYVSCVPIYLDLVLRNIMDNADKYSPRSEPIEVTMGNQNGCVVITVRDHGPGVPDTEFAMIYERFYRSAGTAKATSGAGIGLAVCQRLMESQGGTIQTRNSEGGGLEVTLTLPAERLS